MNADDNGTAKQMKFGGVARSRISSQRLKRSYRHAQDRYALHNIPGAEQSIRSRHIVNQQIMLPASQLDGVAPEVLEAVALRFTTGLYGGRVTSSQDGGAQPLLLGLPKVRYLLQQACRICEAFPQDPEQAAREADLVFGPRKEKVENFRAFRDAVSLPAGLAGAMFGRMTTADTPEATIPCS